VPRFRSLSEIIIKKFHHANDHDIFSNLSPQQESFKLIEFTISLHPIKKTASLMDSHSTTHHELTQKYLADLSRVNYKNKEKSKSMAV
jgi:hypothetical protein